MNDPKLREYAQRENDHILFLLLRSDQPDLGEDPLALAERNCSATTRCFGETDPLHVMALNTLAFVRMYTGEDVVQACATALQAANVLGNVEGHDQMLLESRFLAVQAKTMLGSTTWSAIEEVFESRPTVSDQSVRMEAASELLSNILKASVFKQPLDRPVLIMTLRQLGEQFINEFESIGYHAGGEAFARNLLTFLQTYYTREEDED